MRSREDDARATGNIYGEDAVMNDIVTSLGRIADMLSEMNGYVLDYDDGQKKAEALPKRETGKWILFDNQRQEDIDNGNYMYTCSNCLHSDIHAKKVKVPYCWFCGAKMEVEQE